LTVRNTGHDYSAKATGAGAVGIWTHKMKAIHIFDYNSSAYTGKAMKMGAEVQVFDAYQYAYDRGLVVFGGNCPTVGIAGGYTQGGGHSPLSSNFGMAVDQDLEWEVVTATGEHLIASPSQNADLYRALSGGGGGTYGVIASLAVKAQPDLMSSGANLTFTSV
jgi:FAD/FMN-containing dehydrogenase